MEARNTTLLTVSTGNKHAYRAIVSFPTDEPRTCIYNDWSRKIPAVDTIEFHFYSDQFTDKGLINRADLDARTNAYTLTGAGTEHLQRQTETLAGRYELPRPVTDGGAQY